MRRSFLKRKKKAYGAAVLPKRVAAVKGIDPFVCPECAGNHVAVVRKVVQMYGRERTVFDQQCGQCHRYVRITAFEDRTCDSVMEFDRGEHLRLMQRSGELWDLAEQVEVDLPYLNANGKWRADFAYRVNAPAVGLAGPLGRPRTPGAVLGGFGLPKPPAQSWAVFESVEGISDHPHKVLRRLWADFGPGVLRIVTRGTTRKWTEKDVVGGKMGAMP